MGSREKVLQILDDTLKLGGRALSFADETRLLGALPELDSMAVLALLARIEVEFAVAIHDDEVDGATFEDVRTLVSFVSSKTGEKA